MSKLQPCLLLVCDLAVLMLFLLKEEIFFLHSVEERSGRNWQLALP